LWSDAGNLAPFLLKLKKDFQGDYQNIVQAVQTVAPYFHDFDLKNFYCQNVGTFPPCH
jgi:hypothetical protein